MRTKEGEKKRLTISIKDFYIFLCFFAIFAPLGLFAIKGFPWVIEIARCLIIAYYVLRHIKEKRKLCAPGIFCLLLIVHVSMMTILNRLDLAVYLKNALGIIAFIFYANIEFRSNYNKNLIILERLLFAFLLVNLLMVLLGISLGSELDYLNYLLGMRTRFSDAVYPYICISLMNNLGTKKNNIRLVIGMALSIATVVIPSVATAIGALAIFAILYILNHRIGAKNYRVVLLIMVFLSISILFFRIQDVFSLIIEGALHKNITFTGRTYIWDDALVYIGEKPLLGHGYIASGIAHYWGHLYQPHNQLLDLLANGGALAVFYFVMFLIKTIKYSKTKRFQIAIAMLGAVLFACTFERYAQYPLFYIIPFAIYYLGANHEKKNA